ncbi:MAG: hypothetical protein JWP05_1169, partial [Microbacteriaceae bacterium]|nr:hypothetical protein [Microbacteriaceae bacterium]
EMRRPICRTIMVNFCRIVMVALQ